MQALKELYIVPGNYIYPLNCKSFPGYEFVAAKSLLP
jgi:hypothetical protein